MEVFNKQYTDEDLYEFEQDLFDALNKSDLNIPEDEDGFRTGTFSVVVNWEAECKKVSFERVLAIKQELAVINQERLEDIEWMQDGEPLQVLQQDIDDFKYTGLSNTDFVHFVLENY